MKQKFTVTIDETIDDKWCARVQCETASLEFFGRSAKAALRKAVDFMNDVTLNGGR